MIDEAGHSPWLEWSEEIRAAVETLPCD